ncbi:MAG: DUF402 domain-containing protein [Lachnospiraceae bacterium]|nr:DUF402 domain-containing protein [Lachnospiraceae bacterium]
MANLTLYRKRIIPDECVLLKDDVVLQVDNDTIVTKWNALRPKKDLHHGYSCYYLKEGFKMSKFLDESGNLLYWYFDIVEYDFHGNENAYVVTDLLVDVIINPDGFVKVVDLDELVAAFDTGQLSDYQLKKALLYLNNLLSAVYSPKLSSLQFNLNQYDK